MRPSAWISLLVSQGVLVEQESWKEFIITFPRIALV